MSLTEKNGSPLSIFPSFSHNKRQAVAGRRRPLQAFRRNANWAAEISFSDSRLLALDNSPLALSRSITLPWLSRAVDLLSMTLADAVAIISDPSLTSTDRAAISSHLDSSVALLDACNAISAAADRILRGRLLVCLALHLITSSPTLSVDRRRRALSAIADWEATTSAPHTLPCGSTDLVHRLRPNDPNRGRLTAVRRAIYAVEAVSNLVARSSLAALGDKGDALSGIRASGEFPWAAVYNELVAAVSAKLCRGERAGEVEEAEASVRKLAAAVVEGDGEVTTEELQNAAHAAEKSIEVLTEGLDQLTDAVNRLFRASLETREAALQCFRIVPGKCK